MKYIVKIYTSDERVAEVRLTAQNQADAIARLTRQPEIADYLAGATITRTEVQPDADKSGNVLFFDLCTLYHPDGDPSGHRYAVKHQPTGVVIEFDKHNYNRTAHVANADQLTDLSTMQTATAQRTIADWLLFFRPELLYPSVSNEAHLSRQLSIAADNAGYTVGDLSAISGVQERKLQKMLDGNPGAMHYCSVGTLTDIVNAMGYNLAITPNQKTDDPSQSKTH